MSRATTLRLTFAAAAVADPLSASGGLAALDLPAPASVLVATRASAEIAIAAVRRSRRGFAVVELAIDPVFPPWGGSAIAPAPLDEDAAPVRQEDAAPTWQAVGMPEIAQTTTAAVPDPIPEGVAVVDVREPSEWMAGHIEGSVHIPMAQLVERIAEIPATEQVLVVCRVGSRSARVTAYLASRGYDAVNLTGGLVAWEAAGRALVSETGQPAYVD